MKIPWLNTFEYPFASHYYLINGYRMHYIDEGTGDVLLFVHGTPSWSFEYRNIIKEMSKNFRCIAIDHIGFGLSDKPFSYDYSVQQHSRTLAQFILDHNLYDLTLIVHDFGGPIGLNVAMEHPGRIKRFVILNTWLWNTSFEPEFARMKKILQSPLIFFLYRYLNFSATYLLPKSFARPLSKKILQHYTKPFASSSQRMGTIAFAHSLLKDQEWFESLWNECTSICSKPTLLVWGVQDPLLKSSYLKKFQNTFTNSRAVMLEDCGHSPAEEKPGLVTHELLHFLGG